jgi:hypothetical protein
MSPIPRQPDKHLVLSRREFLRGAGLLLASGLLAACGTEQEPAWQAGDFWRTPTPADLLVGPVETETADAPEGLDSFLALSTVLTGFENLDPALGQVYLGSLQEDPELGGGLPGLYEQAGVLSGSPPDSIAALESAGIFDQESTRSLADRIIELWYTGIYTQGEEQVVATFVDSLAWKSLTFTKPPTICGSFGFWSARPRGEF